MIAQSSRARGVGSSRLKAQEVHAGIAWLRPGRHNSRLRALALQDDSRRQLMKTTSRLALWIATVALAAVTAVEAPRTAAADTAPPPTPIPVAHSALLTIKATVTQDGLALQVLHAANQIPIDGRDVTVSVDGKSQPLTAQPEGTFLLSTKDLGADGERQLDITVAHDGIREILTGKITLPKTASATDLWHNHRQMAWWVLNFAIVLIAALAFSRRTSSPPKSSGEDE